MNLLYELEYLEQIGGGRKARLVWQKRELDLNRVVSLSPHYVPHNGRIVCVGFTMGYAMILPTDDLYDRINFATTNEQWEPHDQRHIYEHLYKAWAARMKYNWRRTQEEKK